MNIEQLRREIDAIDRELIFLLDKRFNITNNIGIAKKKENIKVLNTSREQIVLDKTKIADNHIAIYNVYLEILKISKEQQHEK